MKNLKNFGKILKRIRQSKGLLQWQVAEKSNLGSVTISNFERGFETNPTAETLLKLAKSLDVTPNDLLGVRSKT